MVNWPALMAPVRGKVLKAPWVRVGDQLPGTTRLIWKVCVRVAKFSFNMP